MQLTVFCKLFSHCQSPPPPQCRLQWVSFFLVAPRPILLLCVCAQLSSCTSFLVNFCLLSTRYPAENQTKLPHCRNPHSTNYLILKEDGIYLVKRLHVKPSSTRQLSTKIQFTFSSVSTTDPEDSSPESSALSVSNSS